MAQLLRAQSYFVEVASTAENAIELAVDRKHHLLIVEPHLNTEMEGVDVANTILSFNPQAEVIFVTAWSLEVPKLSIKKPCDVISKPYDDVEILKLVKKCVEWVTA